VDLRGKKRRKDGEDFTMRNLQASPFIRLIYKSKKTGWTSHVARMGGEKYASVQKFVRKP
jgi:hypothetical protein